MSQASIFGGVFQIGRSESGENFGLVDIAMRMSNTENGTPAIMLHAKILLVFIASLR